jgi:hypothetical protein
VHLVHDGPKLGCAFSAAQDEIVSQQGDLLHVQHYDIRAKPFGNGINDNVSEFE